MIIPAATSNTTAIKTPFLIFIFISPYPNRIKTSIPCVRPRTIEITARYRCNLRNLRPSFLRNRPVRKVAATNERVATPKGTIREDKEKEL